MSPRRRDLGLAALSMATGLHLAMLQASHFLLLEAHLSARSQTYLLTLTFWLVGFLIGLRIPERPAGVGWAFPGLLGAGTLCYYAAYALSRRLPFHDVLYVTAALGSAVGALLAGHFFRAVAGRLRPLRRPLLHENNGYLVGLLLSLWGATRFGGRLLAWAPAAGAVLVALAWAAARPGAGATEATEATEGEPKPAGG